MIDTVAAQGDNQVIRNAEAELQLARRLARAPHLLESGVVLSERQQPILGLVVERYVDDGRPVGSRALADARRSGGAPRRSAPSSPSSRRRAS